jgi:hypothetical protein
VGARSCAAEIDGPKSTQASTIEAQCILSRV